MASSNTSLENIQKLHVSDIEELLKTQSDLNVWIQVMQYSFLFPFCDGIPIEIDFVRERGTLSKLRVIQQKVKRKHGLMTGMSIFSLQKFVYSDILKLNLNTYETERA